MIERINPDATSLGALGLTVDMILGGESLDIDPEQKVLPRKQQYVRYDFAKQVIDACITDLTEAYRVVEELEGELARTGEDLENVSGQARTATAQVRQVLAGEEKLSNAEKLLAKFESQLDLLEKDKQADQTMITKLKGEVAELIELKETVPRLEADVNQVLTNLQGYLEEAGVDIPDPDGDDWPE